MNINYKWGFYIDNRLVLIDAQLNTDVEYYKRLRQALKIENLKDKLLVRVGTHLTDGSYVMVDSFKKTRIAYSFGINNDVSWDNDMVNKGFEVYMYDHTINEIPYYLDGFHFFKEGISGNNKPEEHLNTLETYIKRNGHTTKTNMVLKMDVEGAEWDFLETVPVKILKQFDQIVLEFHNLVRACSDEEKERRIAALHKLNATHQLVHLHGNNTGYVLQFLGATFPDVIEVTYVNREHYKTLPAKEIIVPSEIDIVNDRNREDLFLGNWNRPLSEDLFEIEF